MVTVREMVAAVAVVVFTIQCPVLRSTHRAKNLKSRIIFSLISIGKLEATVVRALSCWKDRWLTMWRLALIMLKHMFREAMFRNSPRSCAGKAQVRNTGAWLWSLSHSLHVRVLLTIRGHLPSFFKLLLYRIGVHWRIWQASNKYSLTKNKYPYRIAGCIINKLQCESYRNKAPWTATLIK